MVEHQTPEQEVRVRSSLRSPCCVLEQDTFTSQKVLFIPRKRWLRPDMTEKLFTGTLKQKRNETKIIKFFIVLLLERPYLNFVKNFDIKDCLSMQLGWLVCI